MPRHREPPRDGIFDGMGAAGMAGFLRRCWAQIDVEALRHNMAAVRAVLRPDCRIMAVVKANAYGHGDAVLAPYMQQCGADWFAVSNIEEAAILRRHAVTRPILILGMTPCEYAAQLAEQRLTQTVYSAEYAGALAESAAQAGVTVEVHVKVDTGMNRIGFTADALADIAVVYRTENLRATGIFTHFACADEAGADARAYTRAQYARFCAVWEALRAEGIDPGLRHCCNSGAVLQYPEMQLDMVRPGIILYGLWPSDDLRGAANLRPVMTLYSRVALVKRVPAGACVSYGRKYTAPDERVIATVTCGYADGYSRAFSGRASMLVRGQAAPVVGRVCMDQLMLDVTGIPGVQAGDEVVAAGGALPFDDLARIGGTIGYELVCGVSRRVPRVYVSGGEVLAVADYLE